MCESSTGANDKNDEEIFGYFRDNTESTHTSSTKRISPALGFIAILKQWWTDSLWPGMGLFGESYLLFSIGILTPLWKELYPTCWSNNHSDDVSSEYDDNDAYVFDTCSPRLLESLTYGVVLGVIAGMILLGYWSNHIGRRKGSILTASLMAGGSLGLVALSIFGAKRLTAEHIFQGTVGCLVLFGIGVGGEYPLSASLASEGAMHERSKNQQMLARQERGLQNTTTEVLNDDVSDSLGIVGDESIDHHHFRVTTASTVRTDDRQDRHQRSKSKRGRRVQLVFAMQGMGIWFNSVIMLVLLWTLTGKSNGNDDDDDAANVSYDAESLLMIWRITYAIGASVLCFVLLTRILYLEESKVWLEANKVRATGCSNDGDSIGCQQTQSSTLEISSNDSKHSSGQADITRPKSDFLLVHKLYGSRMFGAGMAWLLWDISFYGNKLFQSTFLLALVGDQASLTEIASAAAFNATVALLGYYGAAILIDIPLEPNRWWWTGGRKNLQSIGLVVTGLLLLACGLLALSSSSSSSTATAMVTMYFVSSLVGQLGPNCTTFLIPAEIVPTDQRTYCHGVCAASGKVGALIAAVVFHFGGGSGAFLFFLCGGAGILGASVTHVFVPETAGLDLLELDLQWKLFLGNEGEGKDCYNGPAIHHEHLSLYERYCIRRREHTGKDANRLMQEYLS